MRSLRLVDKIPESADVTSFVFEARDGLTRLGPEGPLPSVRPGGLHGAIQGELEARGVPAEQIHSESFGPVG